MQALHSSCAMVTGEPCVKPGLYQHYKGNYYQVIALAHHSETLEDYVVYTVMNDPGQWWIRPLTMFCETIDLEGVRVPRFRYVENKQ